MYGLGFGAFRHAMIGSLGGGANGALTTAWISATGETDTTIISALNTLETDLTTYGLTAKIKALYPMVGGTAAKHKFNFMDARDLDAAYRLTFSGGWTHSSTGALPNGTNAYADTFFIPSTAGVGLNSSHFSYYSRTANTASTAVMGVYASIVIGNIGTKQALFPSYLGNLYFGVNADEDSLTAVATNKFYLASRVNSTQQSIYVNSTANTYTRNSAALPDIKMYLGALNNFGSAFYFNARECAFSSIGDGLTPTEAANFYTAVQNFNTTLSRQV